LVTVCLADFSTGRYVKEFPGVRTAMLFDLVRPTDSQHIRIASERLELMGYLYENPGAQ
jgi:hypothetical protein